MSFLIISSYKQSQNSAVGALQQLKFKLNKPQILFGIIFDYKVGVIPNELFNAIFG